VSEQPAGHLPGREETTQFVVKSNQRLLRIMDQTDSLAGKL
jgi:hypothetical protein